jgi:hypothetical protein
MLRKAWVVIESIVGLLAAAVLIRVESVWHDLWNYRIAIDLYLALGSTFVAQYLKI